MRYNVGRLRVRRKDTVMKIGDTLKDNDVRMWSGKRKLIIISIGVTHVTAQQGSIRPVKIRKDRIYVDGKPRRSGFDLIPQEFAK